MGRKVAFANPAVWDKLKLQTVAWGSMYDDTVQKASATATVSVPFTYAPKLEPEIVFKLREPIAGADAAGVLAGVEWVALGFEIIDCVYPEWTFEPMDFVAAYGLHAALVVGEPRAVTADAIPALVDQLAKFKLRLIKNGELVEEGAGRNSLRSPALCLGELARVAPLHVGELVSSGTLTTPTLIGVGDEWKAELDGLDLPSLSLKVT